MTLGEYIKYEREEAVEEARAEAQAEIDKANARADALETIADAAQAKADAASPKHRRPKISLRSYRLNLICIKKATDMYIENSNPPTTVEVAVRGIIFLAFMIPRTSLCRILNC